VTAGDGPLGVHMAPSGAPYLLFVTLPACLVMTTLTAWAGLLLWVVPSYTARVVGPHGGVVAAPVRGRLMADLELRAFPRGTRFSVFDMVRPPPAASATLRVNLSAAHCPGDVVEQTHYLDRHSSLHFRGSTRRGSIRVVSPCGAVCAFHGLAGPFSSRCPITSEGLHRVVYRGLDSVRVTIRKSRFLPTRALCTGACSQAVEPGWSTTSHPLLLLPQDPICVPSVDSARAQRIGDSSAAMQLTRPWGTIFLLGLLLQCLLGGSTALAVHCVTRPTPNRSPNPSPAAITTSYRTFPPSEPQKPVSPFAQPPFDPESVKYLLVFTLVGCFGLHRMYRITRQQPNDTLTLVMATVACVLLGPIFFAQDGFCFADFLREDDVFVLGPDATTLRRLDLKLVVPSGFAVAEQPARHFSYMVFLLPYYWITVTRLTELLQCVEMFSHVAPVLWWASLLLFSLWLLSPTSTVVWSRPHDKVLVVRQWAWAVEVWGWRASVLEAANGQMDWSANVIAVRTTGVHPEKLVTYRLTFHWSTAAVLHFLPVVDRLLADLPLPPPDLFPAPGPTAWQPMRPLLDWDLWTTVGSFMDLSTVARLAVVCRAFHGLVTDDGFWSLRLRSSRPDPRWSDIPARTQLFLQYASRRSPVEDWTILKTGLVPFATTTNVWRLPCATES